MKTKSSPAETVEMLEEHAEALGRLYRLFSMWFPELRTFWSRLAVEENVHARWLRRLARLADEEAEGLPQDRFRQEAIEAALRSVNGQLERMETTNPTSIEALSLAKSLEDLLLDNGLLEVLRGDPPEMARILTRLSEETKHHRARIHTEWSRERNRSLRA
ncbi:MAG: hypothetical protein ABIH26_06965 [Candidatus Eisenbacteria bacterium]